MSKKSSSVETKSTTSQANHRPRCQLHLPQRHRPAPPQPRRHPATYNTDNDPQQKAQPTSWAFSLTLILDALRPSPSLLMSLICNLSVPYSSVQSITSLPPLFSNDGWHDF